MRVHTNAFKQEIAKFGKQIDSRIYKFAMNYNLITENNNNILTEDNIQLITDNFNTSNQSLIDSEDIYNMSIIKNGQLLQSLMKQFNFETNVELKIGDIVKPQFGLLVNNDYEYLDYGNYIIYSKEYNAENQTWNYVAYDFMLKSMIKYEPLNLTYPCTIREYLIALADRIGLTFANASDEFTNYNEQVLEELFEGQNITYRDILDKLSEITASNILINDDNELELGYPNETNDTIDEENLKDVNVNFGEVFGPINKVAITETDGGYEYPAEDSQSIEENGLWQVNINDNLFAFNGDSNIIAQNILNKLNGLYYSINDFSTTGVCYYDYLDLFNVSIGEDTHKCLLLNNEINITQGLEENIFTERRENTKTEQNNYETSIINNKQVQFQINKQKGEIDLRVRKDNIINAINLSEEQIKILANKLNITVEDILNIIANNAINLTTKNITINSNNFNVDSQGNCTANSFNSNNATITGGNLTINANSNQEVINIKTSNNAYQSKVYPSHFYQTNGSQALTVGEFTSGGYYGLWLRNVDNSAPEAYINITNGVSRIVLLDGNSQGFELNSQIGLVEISDKRRKEKIKYIPEELSVNIVKNLNPVEYCLKKRNQKYRGLIAQEVEETLKSNGIEDEIYYKDKDGNYFLVYNQLIADMINTEKYLLNQIETLQKQVQDLERKIK